MKTSYGYIVNVKGTTVIVVALDDDEMKKTMEELYPDYQYFVRARHVVV